MNSRAFKFHQNFTCCLLFRLPEHIAHHVKKCRGVERTLRAEELAGDVEGLTSHNDDLLAVEQLLGDGAGQATKEMSLAVDDDLFQAIQSANLKSN